MVAWAEEEKTGFRHTWGVPSLAGLPASCSGKARRHRRIGTYGKLSQHSTGPLLPEMTSYGKSSYYKNRRAFDPAE